MAATTFSTSNPFLNQSPPPSTLESDLTMEQCCLALNAINNHNKEIAIANLSSVAHSSCKDLDSILCPARVEKLKQHLTELLKREKLSSEEALSLTESLATLSMTQRSPREYLYSACILQSLAETIQPSIGTMTPNDTAKTLQAFGNLLLHCRFHFESKGYYLDDANSIRELSYSPFSTQLLEHTLAIAPNMSVEETIASISALIGFSDPMDVLIKPSRDPSFTGFIVLNPTKGKEPNAIGFLMLNVLNALVHQLTALTDQIITDTQTIQRICTNLDRLWVQLTKLIYFTDETGYPTDYSPTLPSVHPLPEVAETLRIVNAALLKFYELRDLPQIDG